MTEEIPKQLRLYWSYGDKAELARRCQITSPYLSDILAGRTRAAPNLALRLEQQASHMGLHISRDDVAYPRKSNNPLIAVFSNPKRS